MDSCKCLLAVLFLFSLSTQSQCQTLKKDEEVLVFPSYAYEAKDKLIQLSFHAWVFEPEPNSPWRQALVRSIKSFLPAPHTKEEEQILQRRLYGFTADNESLKTLDLRIGSQTLKSGVTGAGGHTQSEVILSLSPAERAELEGGKLSLTWNRGGEQKPLWIGNQGLSIVSDIDDTIKITQVLDRKAMVVNSFFKEFRPVLGMPELYQKLGSKGAVFHYVSAAPWQLYADLQAFLQAHFPVGTVSLRKLRLKDSSGVDFLWGDSKAYKVETIADLMLRFPLRKFLLIGDSGEKDPEVYEEIRRRFPAQIVGILIRIPPEQKFTPRKSGMEYFREPAEIAPALQRWGYGV